MAQFKGFPKSCEDCGRMLLAHEAVTGYQVCPLAGNETRIARNFRPEGGYHILEGDRPIVTFYGDGSRRLRINMLGNRSQGRMARINACLPPGYLIRSARAGVGGYELWLNGQRVTHFNVSYVLAIPEAPAPAEVAA